MQNFERTQIQLFVDPNLLTLDILFWLSLSEHSCKSSVVLETAVCGLVAPDGSTQSSELLPQQTVLKGKYCRTQR